MVSNTAEKYYSRPDLAGEPDTPPRHYEFTAVSFRSCVYTSCFVGHIFDPAVDGAASIVIAGEKTTVTVLLCSTTVAYTVYHLLLINIIYSR